MHIHPNVPTVHLQNTEQLVCVREVEGMSRCIVTHPQGDGDGGHDGEVSGQVPQHDKEAQLKMQTVFCSFYACAAKIVKKSSMGPRCRPHFTYYFEMAYSSN